MTQSPSNNRAESSYFAQPYSLDATGFYFATLDEYRAKADANRDAFGFPVEEYELQYIDGEMHKLFNLLRVNQATLAVWFDLLDELGDDSDRFLIACHLADNGYALDQLAEHWDDYYIYRGTAAEYAEELITETENLPDRILFYLDFERLARDLALEGHFTEVERELLVVG